MVFGSSFWCSEAVVAASHVVKERWTSIRQINRIWDILDECLL